jgi:SAM-dependent methyltransferase
MDSKSKTHWDQVFESGKISGLGWYEPEPLPSLEMIDRCRLRSEEAILDAGAGAGYLADKLLEKGFSNLILADISPAALTILSDRLGEAGSGKTRFLEIDLGADALPSDCDSLALWHDRAVLHFLTEAAQQERYFKSVQDGVRPGGFVILAAYSLNGAKRCAGLPVFNYDSAMMVERIGPDFSLLETFDYVFSMPSGDLRPFVYARFQKKA